MSLLQIAIVLAGVNWITSEPIAKTNFGPVRGKWLRSSRGAPIASFLGLPYAVPPIDHLRFEVYF